THFSKTMMGRGRRWSSCRAAHGPFRPLHYFAVDRQLVARALAQCAATADRFLLCSGGRRRFRSIIAGSIALIGVALCRPAYAKTLLVGPEQPLKAPSAAAAVAGDGDTVEIAPGEYFDCAVWKANHLTIVGTGAGAVITDVSCEGKALFVTRGSDITIRNLTFTRARVPDGNGAGIRAEGDNLKIEGSRFTNNETGVLAIDAPKSTISIADSEFIANGKCARSCAHGIYVNHVALLRIERSKLIGTKE